MQKNKKSENNYSIFATKSILKIVIIVLLVLVLLRITTYVYNVSYNVFSDKPNIGTDKKEYTINIEKGMDIDRIAEILEINGIIQDKTVFKVQAKLASLSKTIQEGSHKLNSYMTAEDIFETLSQAGAASNE